MTTSYGSKDQIARLLALVPYLHAHSEVRLSEAARMLGVTERQLTRDLKVLWMCGLPGGLPDDLIDVDMDALEEPGGDRIIRVDNADYLARPLRLTPTEATALIVALRALRESAADETREIVDRALGKLEQAAASDPRASAPIVHPGEAPDAAIARLEQTLAAAIRDRHQVRLTYYVPARDEESTRVVDPHRLSRAHEAVYLDAWCHSAEAPRWFRLDRVREAEVLDTPISSATPDRDLDDGLLGPDATLATLELDPEARWITEYYPVGDVQELGDGRLRAELPVADPRWLVRLALRAAPHARIVSPPAYAEMYRTALGGTRALYPEGK